MLDRKPASGSTTSDGIGGIRFSSRISRPTPGAPSRSMIPKIQAATHPLCPKSRRFAVRYTTAVSPQMSSR